MFIILELTNIICGRVLFLLCNQKVFKLTRTILFTFMSIFCNIQISTLTNMEITETQSMQRHRYNL